MNFIEKAKAKALGESTLLSRLQLIAGESPPRPYFPLHASSLTRPKPEFCPREAAIMMALKRQEDPQHIGMATRVAFDIGEAIHDMVRDKWLRPYAVGNWECWKCEYTHQFSRVPKSDKCPGCHEYTTWIYRELVAVGTTLPVTGSLDVVVDLGMPKHFLTEVKSIDKDQFNQLAAPLAEHRVRTNLYLHLVADSDVPWKDSIDLTRAKVLYVSKGYGQKNIQGTISPFKEFDVVYTPESIAPYLAKADLLKQYIDHGKMPKGICPTSFVPRVKACHCPKECWGTQFPPAP